MTKFECLFAASTVLFGSAITALTAGSPLIGWACFALFVLTAIWAYRERRNKPTGKDSTAHFQLEDVGKLTVTNSKYRGNRPYMSGKRINEIKADHNDIEDRP